MKIKICGITNLEDAILAQELGADLLGFILYEKSKRYVSIEDALDIKKHVKTPCVGVVVNKPVSEVRELLNHFDFIQLHSDEGCDYNISERLIKVYRVIDKTPFMDRCWDKNLILFDTYTEKYGGSGKSFDWSILKGIKRDFFVSGGLNPENVLELLKTIKPYGIDASSGLEVKPGKKDPDKLGKFIKKVRNL